MQRPLVTYTSDEAPREVLELAGLLVPRLLAGDHPQLKTLRAQYERASIASVEYDGVGFFVNYTVRDEMPKTVPANLTGGDARITVAGMGAPAGCVLFVRDGRLEMLDIYSFVDAWPLDAEVVAVDDIIPLSVGEA
jgi:hypothetical protein